MERVRLGNTDLEVSRICLGTMHYGEPERGEHSWTIGEELSRPIIRRALDQGINFFDTANSYSDGNSEEILGRALKDYAKRDEVVIATKVFYETANEEQGLSRDKITKAINNSLRRLGTDYVDLYQLHRWDYGTPF